MIPRYGLLIVLLVLSALQMAGAAPELTLLTVKPAAEGGETYSVALQVLALMTVLSLAPAGLMITTSFTRIVIVLAILRQGLGTAQTPSNQILIGLALMLTLFVMAPVFQRSYTDAVQPYLDEQISQKEALARGAQPFREFMTAQTRAGDLETFGQIGGYTTLESPETVPWSLLLPSFVTSELKTAFQMGFLMLIPFVIIDLVVASVLMSLGMVMLSPLTISLPFKIMLFVLVDGWTLIMGTLATSFYGA